MSLSRKASIQKKFSIRQVNPSEHKKPSLMETYKDYLIHNTGLAEESAHNYFTRFKKILRSAEIQGYLKVMSKEDIRCRFGESKNFRRNYINQRECIYQK